jgi:hypothetical protein
LKAFNDLNKASAPVSSIPIGSQNTTDELMDDEDMELYGEDDSAEEMELDAAKAVKIPETGSIDNGAAKEYFWIVIYGEEGWLRVIMFYANMFRLF